MSFNPALWIPCWESLKAYILNYFVWMLLVFHIMNYPKCSDFNFQGSQSACLCFNQDCYFTISTEQNVIMKEFLILLVLLFDELYLSPRSLKLMLKIFIWFSRILDLLFRTPNILTLFMFLVRFDKIAWVRTTKSWPSYCSETKLGKTYMYTTWWMNKNFSQSLVSLRFFVLKDWLLDY